jgi:hypothetical protein
MRTIILAFSLFLLMLTSCSDNEKKLLEKCADQRYGPGLSVLGDDLKKKVKSLHYQDLYQSCEREQKTTPNTFKLKYGK